MRNVAWCGDGVDMLAAMPDGVIDCLYLDPPYGTGRAFHGYADPKDPDQWAVLMRRMLAAAAPKMRDSGIVWLHTDRNTLGVAQLLLMEQFGADRQLGLITWQRTKTQPRARGVPATTDFLLVFGAGKTAKLDRIPRLRSPEYKNPDRDPKGLWRPVPLTAPDARRGDGTLLPGVFLVDHPQAGTLAPPPGLHWARSAQWFADRLARHGWRTEVATADTGKLCLLAGAPQEAAAADAPHVRITGKAGEPEAHSELVLRPASFARRLHLVDAPGRAVPAIWTREEVGDTAEAKREILALRPEDSPFPTPKPTRLLRRVIDASTGLLDHRPLIVDPFGGSGTTAATAMAAGCDWATAELNPDTFTRWLLPRLPGATIRGAVPGSATP